MYRRTDRLYRLNATRWAVAVAGVALLAYITANSGAAGAVVPSPSLVYTGDAYGSEVTLAGGVVRSGQTAPVVLGCVIRAGVTFTNSIASVSVPPALSTGTVSTTAATSNARGVVRSTTTAAVQKVKLLQGMVTADAVKAVSATSHSSTGYQTSAAGSSFVNLVVAGHAVGGTPPPNTTIPLSGVGYVILNQQNASSSGQALGVTMIHVFITVAGPMGSVGTQIVVSHALSDLEGPVPGTLDGSGYGTSVNLANVAKSGPSAEVWVPCLGSNGRVHTDTTAGVTLPGVISSGTISNTAEGMTNPSGGSAETTSKVQTINLAAGMVTADIVQAEAHASWQAGGPSSFSDAGSSFLRLVVNGQVVNPAVPANTMMSLPGLGTLWLHRVIQGTHSIEVRMIELIVTTANNPAGLSVGLDVRVAVAEASVHPSA
jgi:hypothetical protein